MISLGFKIDGEFEVFIKDWVNKLHKKAVTDSELEAFLLNFIEQSLKKNIQSYRLSEKALEVETFAKEVDKAEYKLTKAEKQEVLK